MSTTIKISQLELTLGEARELYLQLHEVFGEKLCPCLPPMYLPVPVPYLAPVAPAPWYPYSTNPPYTLYPIITCSNTSAATVMEAHNGNC